MRTTLLLTPLLLLAACGQSSDDAAQGGLSPSESRQLDQDAAAIDINASAPGNGAGEAQ